MHYYPKNDVIITKPIHRIRKLSRISIYPCALIVVEIMTISSGL